MADEYTPTTGMNLQNVMWKEARHKCSHNMQFYLYEMSELSLEAVKRKEHMQLEGTVEELCN